MKRKRAKKTNSFVRFLGESTAHQSAYKPLGMSLRVCNKSEITLPLNAKKIILWKQNIIQIHIFKRSTHCSSIKSIMGPTQ